MRKIPKFASVNDGLDFLRKTLTRLGVCEVALVRNPSYIYSPIEVYPLAPKVTAPLPRLAGIVKDMDGTTTTTEPLCLHSLEWMVCQITGRKTPDVWPGLDHVRDYPHIIGNSTTKHVEYLLLAYADAFDPSACLEAYLRAAAWTLSQGRDAGRRREVLANIPALGLEDILSDAEFRALAGLAGSGDAAAGRPDAAAGRPDSAAGRPDAPAGLADAAAGLADSAAGRPDAAAGLADSAAGRPDSAAGQADAAAGRPDAAAGSGDAAAGRPDAAAGPNASERPPYDPAVVDAFAERAAPAHLPGFRVQTLTDRVRAAVDIYYMRYHVILGDIADGRGTQRAAEVLGSAGGRLIEPMPGVGPFLAAVKGWLGEDLGLFAEEMCAHVRAKNPAVGEDVFRGAPERLAALGRYLSRHPVPVAVVTSSISYEAEIVLGEVFSILRRQIEGWPVSRGKKDALLPRFASPHALYDAMITASDSSEIRLKPHRDLYSIALHTMGLTLDDLPYVAGFEDSESGVTAIRAAGVGLSVAVPFADTAGHDLSAAACILPGQIPEALVVRNCFLEPLMA